MDTESTKSDILEISAIPTIRSVMTAFSAIAEVVTELKNVMKTIEEDRKATNGGEKEERREY